MRSILVTALLLLAGVVCSDTGMVVTEINAAKLYIYDDEGEQIKVLKASAVKKQFSAVMVDGESVTGLPIQEIDNQEGLIAVSLSDFPGDVWIETMAVEIWPGNRLDCPEVTVGKSEIEQSGMTIGFGDHCNKPQENSVEE